MDRSLGAFRPLGTEVALQKKPPTPDGPRPQSESWDLMREPGKIANSVSRCRSTWTPKVCEEMVVGSIEVPWAIGPGTHAHPETLCFLIT